MRVEVRLRNAARDDRFRMYRRWAIDAIPLGALDFDDVAFQSPKWRRPLLTTYPGAAISKGIEEIGSTIMGLFGLGANRA